MNGDRLFVLQVPIITAIREFCCIFYISPERFYLPLQTGPEGPDIPIFLIA